MKIYIKAQRDLDSRLSFIKKVAGKNLWVRAIYVPRPSRKSWVKIVSYETDELGGHDLNQFEIIVQAYRIEESIFQGIDPDDFEDLELTTYIIGDNLLLDLDECFTENELLEVASQDRKKLLEDIDDFDV